MDSGSGGAVWIMIRINKASSGHLAWERCGNICFIVGDCYAQNQNYFKCKSQQCVWRNIFHELKNSDFKSIYIYAEIYVGKSCVKKD